MTRESTLHVNVIPMTCYFKNSRMTDLFEELGIQVTRDNRDAIDQTLHFYLSVDYPNCAATWKIIRKRLSEDGPGFKKRLREVLAGYIIADDGQSQTE
jgi:hypothetical protein